MPVLAVLLSALVLAGAFVGVSLLRHPELDPVDPAAEERRLVRALARRPRLAAFARRRLDATTAGGLLLTLALTIVFVATTLVGVVLAMVDDHSGIARWDAAVSRWGADHATSSSIDVLRRITWFGGTACQVLVLVTVALVGGLRRRDRARGTVAFLATVGVGVVLLENGVKYAVDRDRPQVLHLTGFSGPSFPSGHAATSAATWAAAALVLGIGLRRPWRVLLAFVAAVIAGLVAASRALLGVHWLTDVVAGVVVGWGWFLLCAVAFGGRILRLGDPALRVGAAAAPPDAPRASAIQPPPRQARAALRPHLALATRRALAAYASLTTAMLLLGTVVVRVLVPDGLLGVDARTSRLLAQHRVGWLDVLTEAWSRLADTLGIVVVAAIAVGVLARRGRARAAALPVTALVLELSVFLSTTYAVHRPRPAVERLGSTPSTGSFPSGHTAATVALYGALAWIALHPRHSHTGARLHPRAVAAVPAVLAFVVAFSRVYRGMHYVSDVLAGAMLGLGCLVGAGWALAPEPAGDLVPAPARARVTGRRVDPARLRARTR